jgi:hypothetical protein
MTVRSSFNNCHVPSPSDLFLSGLVVNVTSLITVSLRSIPLTLLFLTCDLLQYAFCRWYSKTPERVNAV